MRPRSQHPGCSCQQALPRTRRPESSRCRHRAACHRLACAAPVASRAAHGLAAPPSTLRHWTAARPGSLDPVLDAGSGYLCQMEPVAHYGLRNGEKVNSVTIKWTDGSSDNFNIDELNKTYVFRKGI